MSSNGLPGASRSASEIVPPVYAAASNAGASASTGKPFGGSLATAGAFEFRDGGSVTVRLTRRVRDGVDVHLDLTADPALAFGAGPHRCPGRAHATAIAAGVLAAQHGSSQSVRDT